ncbi:MAG: Crp/Fnr family transcriptional regulator [Acidiferrobacterales bacterium]
MAENKERLIALLRRLPAEQVAHLLDYAEFLLQRHGLSEQVPQPEDIPRPAQETVVQAIKRLSASYPMLDRQKLFGETTALMAQHLLEGKDVVAVVDELELLFRRHYNALIDSEKDTRGE